VTAPKPKKLPEHGKKDAFASFLEDPNKASFRDFMKNHMGEGREYDFKREWLEANQLVKKILGFANKKGGVLVFGVAENDDGTFDVTGLSSMEDKADITNKLQKFLPTQLMEQISVLDFAYDASEYAALQGKKFQVVAVDYDPQHIPYMAISETTGVKKTTIYVRRDGNTAEATYEELQQIIDARLAVGISSEGERELKKHLEQLKALYEELPRRSPFIPDFGFANLLRPPSHKGELYSDFIERMISEKKKVIENEVKK